MRILALSDMHGHLPPVSDNDYDLLIMGGDICPDFAQAGIGSREACLMQGNWLNTTFRAWLDACPVINRVLIWGNHDFVSQRYPQYLPEDLPCTVLHDSGCQLGDFKIWGTPWQPPFFDWAYNLPEDELAQKFNLIPEDTDLLVSHGPPRGYGDRTVRGEPVGSTSLSARIQELAQKRLRTLICGHIHEARGMYQVVSNNCTLNICNVALAPPNHAAKIGYRDPVEIYIP